jgi:adenylate cyclase
MANVFKRQWRLKPSILTLFLLLTLPVFAAIVATTYLSNDAIVRTGATRLLDRFRNDAISGIQNAFDPIKTLVRSAAEIGNEYPDFYYDTRPIRYFHSMLQHSDKVVSVYVGLEDGSFRQARRLDPKVPVQGKLPPEGTIFATRWIDVAKDTTLLDRYIFLNGKGEEIGASSEPTVYDPRSRGWYRNTASLGETMITPPDVFATLGLIGFTVAAPFSSGGKTRGVVAVDITLQSFSEYLAEHKVSANTLSYILDNTGRVIANSDLTRTYSSVGGRVELQHVAALGNDLAAQAFMARPRNEAKAGETHQFSFSFNGQDYVASLSTLPEEFGTRWQLFVITPLRDFTRPFEEHNNRLLMFGIVVVLLQVAIILYLSSVLSRPLEQLALKVGRIQELQGDSAPSPPSSIREISVLSRAIDTLDTAIKSFASYVPVGLVRQLLESDQKLELGGHSRFLTVFFSDLEAFSTLAEAVPSQEVLKRVSAYLDSVTRIVDEEGGTIDKFLGDGVMAFWGAPVLMEDHAWRACVAAVRIQRGMKELNAQWEAEGMRSLKPRIGIHCDAVTVGNIGSRRRMSYTVMGDGVNVAARLEAINKEYFSRICISHSVYKETGERLVVRPIAEVTVKGRRATIPIYDLLAVRGAGAELEPDEAMLKLSAMSGEAYEAVVAGDKDTARRLYRDIVQAFPDDEVSRELLRRLDA